MLLNSITIMNFVDIISWVAIIISVSTSIVRAIDIGYQWHTYVLSSICNVLLIYNAYCLGSNQLIVLNIFYMLVSFVGIYRRHNEKINK